MREVLESTGISVHVRIFETDGEGRYVAFPLAGLRARHVDDYVSPRRGEHAAE